MLCTPSYLIDIFNSNNNIPDAQLNTICIKNSPFIAPPSIFTENISNYIIYSLENNIADIEQLSGLIKNMLSSQITDINSDYFGLFPYALTLTEKDLLLPDYDFQSVILLPLLKCYIEYRHLFAPELMTQLAETITLTANIISYNSNLIDTHNKLLEIIFLVVVGEYFSIPQYVNSARNKINSYYYFIKYNKNMPPEYNSPDHIIDHLEAIDNFYIYINSPDIKNILDDMKNILLTIFYRHFNPHLFQWTGPFSLHSSIFITDNALKRIFQITNQKNTDSFIVPDKFRHISSLYGNQFEQFIASQGYVSPYYKLNLVATVYNTRTFSFCSFNHDDLWLERKPCIGYFGDRKSPYCFYIECLLNDIPFSSASFHSIQHKEVLLGHINFSVNRGYKTLGLDVDKSYKTKDLRIRFRIEGDTSKLKISHNNNEIKIAFRRLIILFNTLYSALDDNEITYEYTLLDDGLYFDIVLYNGKEIDLELAKINNAITAFSLHIGKKETLSFTPKTYEDEKFLYSETNIDGVEIKLKSHKKPNDCEVIFSQDVQYVSGTEIATYIEMTDGFTKHHDFFFEKKNDNKQFFLKENNFHNNEILKMISEISEFSLNNALTATKKIFKYMSSFSVIETKHYSILILHQLYELAKKQDKRFIRMIEVNYDDIYKKLRTMTDKKKIKGIITDTAIQLNNDYKDMKIRNMSNTSSIIEEIIMTIHSDYDNFDLSLQNIAEKHGVQESYISRKFTEYMGISYIKYLTQFRINKATELLTKNPDIDDIHTKCGYYNMQTFTIAFKKVTGLTVKNFLKSNSSNKTNT